MSNFLDLWPVALLIGSTLGSGAAAGLVLASVLDLRDLHLAATRDPRRADSTP